MLKSNFNFQNFMLNSLRIDNTSQTGIRSALLLVASDVFIYDIPVNNQ